MDTYTLFLASDVVLEATVTDVHTDRGLLPLADGGANTASVTWLELDVESTWKGAVVGDTVYMRLPGGVEGTRSQRWAHAPMLGAGDQIILFGTQVGTPALNAVSLDQGIQRLETEGQTEVVRTGLGATVAAVPVYAPYQLHVAAFPNNDSGDGNCDLDLTSCDWGNSNTGLVNVSTTPIGWAATRSALTTAAAAAVGQGESALTVDHTAVQP